MAALFMFIIAIVGGLINAILGAALLSQSWEWFMKTSVFNVFDIQPNMMDFFVLGLFCTAWRILTFKIDLKEAKEHDVGEAVQVFFMRMFMIGSTYGILYVYHLVLNGWLM